MVLQAGTGFPEFARVPLGIVFGDFGCSQSVKLTAHGIYIRKRQLARVGSIREQDENSRVFGVDPERSSGKAVMAETVRREVAARR